MRAAGWTFALSIVAAACEGGPSPGSDASMDATVGDADVIDGAAGHDADGASSADAPDAVQMPPACAAFEARAIGSGWNHALAVERDGSLRAWGANGSGQLGAGDQVDRARAAAVGLGGAGWRVVAGGSRHSCGVRVDGTLWCWGVNVHGQLGTGDTDDRVAPARVGVESDWVEVTCGGLHSCGVRAGGTLWCWGANPAGQLGLGDQTGDRTAPQRVGVEAGWSGLSAKARFNCALRPDASLWCWGDNSDGQLGTGDTADRRAPVAIGEGTRWARVRMGPLHTCAITTEGALYCWGLNDYGQLGTGDVVSARTPRRVGADTDWRLASGGFEHTCAIKTDGSLWCWGHDALGQLGVGGTEPARRVPTRALSEARGVEDVVTGQGYTCALDATGAVRCWGDNVSGQAGGGARSPSRPTPGLVCAEAP